MRIDVLLRTALVIWLSLRTLICPFTAEAAESPIEQSSPHYTFGLSLNEFSILNVAEMDGLLKYGGSGDFKLSMAKVGSEVVWTVTIDNARFMELLGVFVGEKTVKLIQGLDLENIDSNQKIALTAIKSLTAKFDAAQKNPVWDSMKLSGVVVQKETNWLLQTKDESFKLTGDKLPELQDQSGKAIVADGFMKKPGEFEVTRFIGKRENTLELFVMSFCPFGQRAESSLLQHIAKANTDTRPSLEVRYIFYKQQKDGVESFVSLHGEEEIVENLVQIVIRESFPAFFQAYLQLRAEGGRAPWKSLTEKVGFSADETAEIEQIITTKCDEIIRKEYEYVTGRYDIKDGSPTFVWESERVPDLKKIEAFKGLTALNGEACAN